MKEYLNEKEKILLDRLKKEYRETGEVILYPPIGLFDEATLNNLLTALCIRGYLMQNSLTLRIQMSRGQIILSEKALNRFNAD